MMLVTSKVLTLVCLLTSQTGSTVSAGSVSSKSTNLKVSGTGYLRFTRQGKSVFARQMTVSPKGGTIVGLNGAVLWPQVALPAGTVELECSATGELRAIGSTGKTTVGQVILFSFPGKPEFNLVDGYLETSQVGKPFVMDGSDTAKIVATLVSSNSNPALKATANIATPVTIKPTVSVAPQRIAAAKAIVRFPNAQDFEGDELLLGQIAKIEADEETAAQLARVSLGKAPYPGMNQKLNQLFVRTALQQAGFEQKNVEVILAPSSVISRPGQTIESEIIVAAANKAIAAEFGAMVEYLPGPGLRPTVVPAGDYQLKSSQILETTKGYRCQVDIFIKDKKVQSQSVELFPDPKSPNVKAGEVVRLRLVRNGAALEISAKVRKGGFLGQRITVETIPQLNERADTKTVHTGVLAQPGLVEVKL